jgi:hypothetical protein
VPVLITSPAVALVSSIPPMILKPCVGDDVGGTVCIGDGVVGIITLSATGLAVCIGDGVVGIITLSATGLAVGSV